MLGEKTEAHEFLETSFQKILQTKVLKGIDTLAEAVKCTLGPNGKYVIVKKNVERFYTKDGVTVAKNILFKDPYENLGAEMIKEASVRTNDLAGDGTTTSVVLAQALIHEGIKKQNKFFHKKKAIEIEKEIQEDTKEVIKNLTTASQKIETPEQVLQVSNIAANDTEIGNLIGEIYNTIGKDGLVITEDSKTAKTWYEVINGLRFNKGFVSPYFMTDNKKERAEIDDPYILITDLEIVYFNNIIPIVDAIAKENGKSLVVIADKIKGEALLGMIQNKIEGRFQFIGIEAPMIDRDSFLEDLALITGGKYIAAKMNPQLLNLELKDLGRAKKVICDGSSTVIVDGQGNKSFIEEKITFLKLEPEYNQERLKRFTSKIAVLKVGAITETELLAKKYQYEDAIQATRSALESGIVAGGGLALLNASEFLPESSIVKQACKKPFLTIMENIDLDGRKMLKYVGGSVGYDAKNGNYENMMDAGIVDALKVVTIALENASSIATLFLRSGAVILNTRELKEFNEHPIKW